MMKINAIIKELKKYDKITDFAIKELKTSTFEQFYDLQKLETTRMTNTSEINVRIYTKALKGDKTLLGNASFDISHKISKSELDKLIEDAIYQASFVENEFYELVEGTKKLSFKQKDEEKDPFEILQEIASIYFNAGRDNASFNALECFYNQYETHLVTSRGVDYKNKKHKIMVEAIPSYNANSGKRLDNCELYRMNEYETYDEAKIKEDACNAISDVLNRSKALKFSNHMNVNVIIKEKDILNMLDELIVTYDYSSVYSKSNFHKIGDEIQTNPKNPLNLSLIPSSKGDYFDSDGVLLKEAKIINNGKLESYYGNNRFAYYLGIKPTGNLQTIKVAKGKKAYSDMLKKPYIEILDLSGIQVDLFADYIGGEVRLANYFDGKDTYPITAFSFSGSLKKCIDELELSKEMTKIPYYVGPKYALLKDFEII